MKHFVLGKSLPHSLSPQIHKLFGFEYGKVEVLPDQLESFVKSQAFDGFNVTVPYKKDIIRYLDEISPSALEIGAVNTVVKRANRLYGYNTDAGGMEYALKRAGIVIDGKNVAILGTGGTSNTAEYVLKNMGAKSVIKVGRTSAVNYDNVYALKSINVVVNTTPVGTFPDADSCPLEIERFLELEAVFDVNYNPLETELIRRAKNMGVKFANGLGMLVEQARLADQLFYDKTIDQSMTEKVLNEVYVSLKNVVLIGMPSCGKSSVGKALARLMNRQFIDLDQEIIAKTGTSIESIFQTHGEQYFRDIEQKVLKEKAGFLGAVIATGGGAVMREDNFIALKRNGTLVYVKRDLEFLEDAGRPLSKSVGVKELFERRKGVYERADFSVENSNKEICQVAEEIKKYYEENTRY